MAIIGRNLDVSLRKEVLQWDSLSVGQSVLAGAADSAVLGVSTLVNMFMLAFPCTIQSGAIYSLGNSGSPVITLNVNRFAAGATVFKFATMALTVFGTSGVQGLSGLPAQSSTLLNLLQGDIIQMVTSGANTAIGQTVVQLVVKKTQDIVAYNNVST